MWQALREAALFHGLFDFALLATSAYNGNIGWIHPRKGFTGYLLLGVAFALVLGLAGVLVRRMQHYDLLF